MAVPSCSRWLQRHLHHLLGVLWYLVSHGIADEEPSCQPPGRALVQLSSQLYRHAVTSSPVEGENTSERKYYLVPHHKGGTVMCLSAAQFMNSALNEQSGLERYLVEAVPNTMGMALDPASLETVEPSCSAHFNRNPFEMVVSGYMYHMAEAEDWVLTSFAKAREDTSDDCHPFGIAGKTMALCNGQSQLSSDWKYRMRQGIAQVFNSSISGPLSNVLPNASLGETFSAYLMRVDLNASLIAEFILAAGASLAPMSSAHDFMESHPCSINTCFNEFHETDCNATWERVVGRWEIQEPQRRVMLEAARRSCPGVDIGAETHSTKRLIEKKSIAHVPEHEMVKLLRELDGLFLNGTLKALEAKIECPVSGKYEGPS